MIHAIVLPADPLLPVRLIEHDETDLDAAQTLVGGLIEPVTLSDPAATLYVSQEGKIHRRALNERATLLAWTHAPDLRGHDVLAGDAYLTGPPRRDRDTDAPAALVAILTGAAPALTRTRTRHRPARWTTVPQTMTTAFGAPFDAYATALLALNQPDTLDARVIPANTFRLRR